MTLSGREEEEALAEGEHVLVQYSLLCLLTIADPNTKKEQKKERNKKKERKNKGKRDCYRSFSMRLATRMLSSSTGPTRPINK